jgi:hypothetical protein
MEVQFISVFVFSAEAGAAAAEMLLMIYFDNEVKLYISAV